MIERFESPEGAVTWCRAQRAAGGSLGFVPTMGALHTGHLELVARARDENDKSCVSIFVNPLQFDDPRDLERYPRDLDDDAARLAELGCDMVFTGTLDQFFPDALDADGRLPRELWVDPGPGAEGLESEFRPGHLNGVATIVDRLFDVVRPDRAYFGAKDFQQCLVVTEVARRRGEPTVVVCPTVRESSGLALSSRNLLLDGAAREQGLFLSRALTSAREAWIGGERDPVALEALLASTLAESSLEVEYGAVRDPERWTRSTPDRPLEQAVALVAARVAAPSGEVRLIDNQMLSEANR